MLETTGRSSGPRGRGRSRGHARGGIGKARSSPAPRVDKDGDLDMGSSTMRPRGGRSGRGNLNNRDSNRGVQSRGGRPARPQRNPFDNTTKIQQLIARGLETGDAVVHKGKHSGPKRDQICVSGWQDSKAAANRESCLRSLKEFIERKASKIAGHNIKLTSTRTHGQDFIINALPVDAEHILKLNTFSFAGAPLRIEQQDKAAEAEHKQPARKNSNPVLSDEGKKLQEDLKSMLARRYNAETKLLDLSNLGANDPEFAGSEMFDTEDRKQKFVPALMKVCDQGFDTAAKKREMVLSITLANNSLPNVTTVTAVAQTFPDLINLDLSNNQIKHTNDLKAWSRRFRSLDHLILANNPIESQQPQYQEIIPRWFRTLKTLNNTQVRTEEEAAKYRKPLKLSPIIAPPNFQDLNQIGENFIKYFFPLFDTNRTQLANSLYDAESTFTVNVNVSGHHTDEWKPAGWGDWIKKSHNLLKITHTSARLNRCFTGPTQIRNCWNSLPQTTHPDILGEPLRWCIECTPVPGLPDPHGQSLAGLSGLMIIVHGQFAEPPTSNGGVVMRSFDRTFMLGAGGGINGLRVISDILVLRTFGGFDGFTPTNVANVADANSMDVNNPVPAPIVPATTPVAPTPTGVDTEQAQKQHLVMELSKVTNLTPHYAQLCLEQANWVASETLPLFEAVKSTLPAEAFMGTEQL